MTDNAETQEQFQKFPIEDLIKQIQIEAYDNGTKNALSCVRKAIEAMIEASGDKEISYTDFINLINMFEVSLTKPITPEQRTNESNEARNGRGIRRQGGN